MDIVGASRIPSIGAKLLAMADERLEDNGTTKLRGLLGAGDPVGHVREAWTAKECLRDLYTLHGQPELAGRWDRRAHR